MVCIAHPKIYLGGCKSATYLPIVTRRNIYTVTQKREAWRECLIAEQRQLSSSSLFTKNKSLFGTFRDRK
ncbi:unnamed protein product [Trifolium pratense]|uniref:Uncharacterized protein n=1 Tax=Trifolium pratense TaxID=57577 RepID=A0ACB0M2K9_TRIPR|nr:unnamed protein product [Trifolium pratense]